MALRGALAVSLASLLVAAACGGGGSTLATPTVAPRATTPVATAATAESPGDGAVRLEKLLSTQGYDAFYDQIHPEIQRFIPKQLFLDCANKGIGGITQQTFDSIQVGLVRDLKDAVFNRETFVPDSDQPKVVTLGLVKGTNTTGLSRRIAVADGQWKWFLGAAAIQAYQSQQCPGVAP